MPAKWGRRSAIVLCKVNQIGGAHLAVPIEIQGRIIGAGDRVKCNSEPFLLSAARGKAGREQSVLHRQIRTVTHSRK